MGAAARGPANEILLLIGAVLAASYLASGLIALPFPAEPLWKSSGIVLFGVYALTKRARLAAAGLFASAVGDFVLALTPPAWTLGMAAFALAHLFYLAVFAALIRTGGAGRKGVPLAALALAASAGLCVWFFPAMGALRAPGLAYQTIITLMVVAALVSKAPPAARIGAVLFMVSDTLIALGLYKQIAVPPGSVWSTYALAQALIAFGLGKAASGESRT